MKNFIAFLKELQAEKMNTSERAGSPIIQTTQRTEIKNRAEQALLADLIEATNETDFAFFLGLTPEGIVLAIEHDDLIDKTDIVGEIPFEFNIKIKNLDYNTEGAIEDYAEEVKIKAEEKRQAEIAKKAKIKKDAEIRAEKKKQKELEETMKKLKATE
jgi:hypothetical protein